MSEEFNIALTKEDGSFVLHRIQEHANWLQAHIDDPGDLGSTSLEEVEAMHKKTCELINKFTVWMGNFEGKNDA